MAGGGGAETDKWVFLAPQPPFRPSKSVRKIFKRWFISWIEGQNVQKLLIFASHIASILKSLWTN